MLAEKWWTSAHLRSLTPCFRTSAAIAADPLATPASVKVVRLSGEVTVRSKAAGLPIIQFCTRISAGRLCLLSAPKPQPTSSYMYIYVHMGTILNIAYS